MISFTLYVAEFRIQLTNQKVVTSIPRTQGPFLDVKFQNQRETESDLYVFDGKEEDEKFKKKKSQETFQQVLYLNLPKRRCHGVVVKRLERVCQSFPVAGVVKSSLGGGPATALLVNWEDMEEGGGTIAGSTTIELLFGLWPIRDPTRPLAIT